jgi:hypothetical protein
VDTNSFFLGYGFFTERATTHLSFMLWKTLLMQRLTLYFPYRLKQVNPKDFGFILNKATTIEGKRLKFTANLLLIFFYADLFVLIFLKDIANIFAP